MIPDLTDEQLSYFNSHGEVQVYRALKEGLPNSYSVFSQVAWILKRESDEARDGETDFIIIHPHYGYLCIEVKGGGISFNAGADQWYSRDRYGREHLIKNPIQQAKNAKYSIRAKLLETELKDLFKESRIPCGHAVFFPDITDASSISRLDLPGNLIGTNNDLLSIKIWVDDCFDYWIDKDSSSSNFFGQKGIDIFGKIFSKSFTVQPLISLNLRNEEEIRITLTKEQTRVLDTLRKRRRVVVSGGAGTGKTILAVEKAKRLAKEGFSTLLTCYNRPLADYLAAVCNGIDGLTVMSFHQLCYSKIKEASSVKGNDILLDAQKTYPGEDLYDVQLPCAALFSLDYITERYDAIVCDEGQDFREEYWAPLELLLADENKTPFYIFYDDNQNLYSRVSTFPVSEDETFPLLKNCRNTVQVHEISYRHYKGDPIDHSNINGEDIEYIITQNSKKQAVKIHSKIQKLILDEQIEPNQITVLIVDALHQKEYFDTLKTSLLPKGYQYTDIEQRNKSTIVVTTVNKFKGLESDVVFLWGLDSIILKEQREQLYVGLSRAKSILIIVGNEQTCLYLQN
ncbi:hypothetical protein BK143_10970 [Paenibacillus peoriae]|uniref:NERD domain-containing protein n=2 Tax=Paenibacillus TaxID=44249 RepID=UPI00096E5DB3|nr:MULTISPECIES: nuclease-related domain-containing DEAD/DEAH box helicase [Paenibacillus]OMF72936.1 hypothetical protein BK143_10970 [Paenibacillus peoriae]